MRTTSCDLGKDGRDSGRGAPPITRDKGKGPILPDDVDTLVDDELSLSSSPSLNLPPLMNTRESKKTRSPKMPSPYPAFSDVVSGASSKARRKAGRRQYRSGPALGNPPMLPPVPPAQLAFDTVPMLYIPSAALIWRPDDMLSSPLGQHILNYEPPCRFVMSAFTMALLTLIIRWGSSIFF